jgi:hypothetical protein
MMRLTALITALGVAAMPQVLSCAESRPPDAAIRLPEPAPAALVATREIEIPYGADGTAPGYSPGGNEREPLGPIAIEVLADGTIRITDSLRRSVFDVRVDSGDRTAIAVAGPMPRRPEARSGGVPTDARAVKTSAEEGEIVFAEGGGERRVAIRAGGPLAAIRLVGVDRAGRAFALLERYRELGKPAVDREIVVLDRAGALIASAALPGVAAVPPLVELYLTPDGALYRLAADADAARVTVYEVRP